MRSTSPASGIANKDEPPGTAGADAFAPDTAGADAVALGTAGGDAVAFCTADGDAVAPGTAGGDIVALVPPSGGTSMLARSIEGIPSGSPSPNGTRSSPPRSKSES